MVELGSRDPNYIERMVLKINLGGGVEIAWMSPVHCTRTGSVLHWLLRLTFNLPNTSLTRVDEPRVDKQQALRSRGMEGILATTS